MSDEIWENITGYDGLYMVSSFGRVKRLPSIIRAKHGLTRPYPGRIMRLLNHDGYLRVMLSADNKQKIHWVHRLVAQAFIPNPGNKPFINHINAVRSDNQVSNLEWCTQSENIQHAFNIGTKPKPTGGPRRYGKDHPLSKKVNQLSLAGDLMKTWDAISCISREMRIATGNIIKCCKGLSKTAYGFKWEYA